MSNKEKYFYSESLGLIRDSGKSSGALSWFDTEDEAYIHFYKNKLETINKDIEEHARRAKLYETRRDKLNKKFSYLKHSYPEEFV